MNIINSKYQGKLPQGMEGERESKGEYIWKYGQELDYTESLRLVLLRRNPVYHVNGMLEVAKAFMMVFTCLKESIDGFRSDYRPFICHDSCLLRSKYLDNFLIVSDLDGNNGLFQVAFAVVERKSGKTMALVS